jgi:hypothetical protein
MTLNTSDRNIFSINASIREGARASGAERDKGLDELLFQTALESFEAIKGLTIDPIKITRKQNAPSSACTRFAYDLSGTDFGGCLIVDVLADNTSPDTISSTIRGVRYQNKKFFLSVPRPTYTMPDKQSEIRSVQDIGRVLKEHSESKESWNSALRLFFLLAVFFVVSLSVSLSTMLLDSSASSQEVSQRAILIFMVSFLGASVGAVLMDYLWVRMKQKKLLRLLSSK